jgi:NADH-quinone oxidoreductase subunit M
MAAHLALLVVAMVASDARVVYAALAAAGGALAGRVRTVSTTGAAYLVLSTVALLSVAIALAADPAGAAAGARTAAASSALTIAFAASLAAIVLRAGLFPLHAGSAALAEHDANVQLEHLAGLPVLVFAHLRFLSDGSLAHDAAPAIVAVGGASMLGFAIAALTARDLRALYVHSTLMHGGMLVAAVGAAGRGHVGAAILVVITMVLALAGFHVMLGAFEARVGGRDAPDFAGRARAFPRLAASLAFFGGAAVGLPGSAGFVADDLLLHALWEESATTAVVAIVASALLAVATLHRYARAFFGPPQRHLAPDLLPRERRVAVLLMVLLLVLGLVPQVLVSPVNALLQ